jgi:hypothetical protein
MYHPTYALYVMPFMTYHLLHVLAPRCHSQWVIVTEVYNPTCQSRFVYILLSITNKMQRYTIFFITLCALHVSGGSSAHHQELKNCTHSIWYMSSLLAATNSPTLAVGASKLDIYQMLCVQFLSSWWWAEEPPETCRALTAIKNIV